MRMHLKVEYFVLGIFVCFWDKWVIEKFVCDWKICVRLENLRVVRKFVCGWKICLWLENLCGWKICVWLENLYVSFFRYPFLQRRSFIGKRRDVTENRRRQRKLNLA